MFKRDAAIHWKLTTNMWHRTLARKNHWRSSTHCVSWLTIVL